MYIFQINFISYVHIFYIHISYIYIYIYIYALIDWAPEGVVSDVLIGPLESFGYSNIMLPSSSRPYQR